MKIKTMILIILTIVFIIVGVFGAMQLLKAMLTLIAELFFIISLGGV